MPLASAATSRASGPGLVVVGEQPEIRHAHRIHDAVEVVAFVLQQRGPRAARLVAHMPALEVLVAMLMSMYRGTLPCRPGIDRQRSHTGVFASLFGVMTGLTITVHGRGSRPEPRGMRAAMMR